MCCTSLDHGAKSGIAVIECAKKQTSHRNFSLYPPVGSLQNAQQLTSQKLKKKVTTKRVCAPERSKQNATQAGHARKARPRSKRYAQ